MLDIYRKTKRYSQCLHICNSIQLNKIFSCMLNTHRFPREKGTRVRVIRYAEAMNLVLHYCQPKCRRKRNDNDGGSNDKKKKLDSITSRYRDTMRATNGNFNAGNKVEQTVVTKCALRGKTIPSDQDGTEGC